MGGIVEYIYVLFRLSKLAHRKSTISENSPTNELIKHSIIIEKCKLHRNRTPDTNRKFIYLCRIPTTHNVYIWYSQAFPMISQICLNTFNFCFYVLTNFYLPSETFQVKSLSYDGSLGAREVLPWSFFIISDDDSSLTDERTCKLCSPWNEEISLRLLRTFFISAKFKKQQQHFVVRTRSSRAIKKQLGK